MTVKRVGIVGSGIMGSGIAEVAAKAGFEVVLRSRAQATADAMVAGLEKSLAKQVERGKLEADERDAVLGRVRAVADLGELAECDLVIESIVEDLADEEAPLHRARPHLPRPHDPRDEHVDAAGRRDGDEHRPSRQGVRHPLLQPRADDGAGRGRARDHLERRDDREPRPRSRRRAARTRCRCKDQAGFIVNALLFPYLNNAAQAVRRRRRDPRRHRRRDEGRLQLPDGPARAARPRRSRHEPGDPRGALRGVQGPELRRRPRCCAAW